MKNSKKILAGVLSAVVFAATMVTTASAAYYDTARNDVTYNVKAIDYNHVHQLRTNPYKKSTNYVLNSTYQISNNKYTITAIYGAQPFVVGNVVPYYRMAQVRTFDSNGNVIANSNPVYKTANDVTSFAQLSNISYSSKLDHIVFNGDSRTEKNKSATTYCSLQCRLNMG